MGYEGIECRQLVLGGKDLIHFVKGIEKNVQQIEAVLDLGRGGNQTSSIRSYLLCQT